MNFSNARQTGNPVPLVSVLMLTYNHAAYIAQAIESIASQVTTFSVEILVGDDGSTDGTREVVRQLQERCPNLSLYCSGKNRGMYHNLAQVFYRARGKYIAFLEGDDFWSCPGKLQRQVEILESSTRASLCFHPVALMKNGEVTRECFPITWRPDLDFGDLLQENWIPTCSVVFRRAALPSIPSWIAELPLLDWPIFLLLAQRGEVVFLPGQWAVYRIHSAGAWSPLAPEAKSLCMIQVLRMFRKYAGDRCNGAIDRRIAELYQHIAWCCEEKSDFHEAIVARWKSFLANSFLNSLVIAGAIKLAVRSRGN